MKQCGILVILYGDIEFDGRVRRMIQIAKQLGDVYLVDIGTQTYSFNALSAGNHRRVIVCGNDGKFARHLKLWWNALRVTLAVRPRMVAAEDYFATLPGWLAAKLSHASLVYDAHELIVPEPGRRMSMRDRFWYLLERFVVTRADLVVAANPERANLMRRHYNLGQLPTFMRNIPPARELTEADIACAIEHYPVLAKQHPDEILVIYQGDVSLVRGLARFVLAFTYLPQNFRLIVAGTGPDMAELQEIGRDLSAEGRLVLLGRVPQQLLTAVTRKCDLGIVSYPYTGLNNIYCAPNKVFEYAQAGLPIIATDQPPIRSLIERYGTGLLVGESDKPEAISALIKSAISHRIGLKRGLDDLLSDHDSGVEAERLEGRMREILRFS